MLRRTLIALLTAVAFVLAAAAPAAAKPATAATTAAASLIAAATTGAASVGAAEKAKVLARWTRVEVTSYNAWNAARLNRGPWAAYAFDWSTDNCSSSPDQPLGFDFRLPCQRHDFGYRNYKAANAFPANKAHVDDSFYADLRRRCDTYAAAVRPSCRNLAWTYYNAVRVFGSLASVQQSDLDRAAALVG